MMSLLNIFLNAVCLGGLNDPMNYNESQAYNASAWFYLQIGIV